MDERSVLKENNSRGGVMMVVEKEVLGFVRVESRSVSMKKYSSFNEPAHHGPPIFTHGIRVLHLYTVLAVHDCHHHAHTHIYLSTFVYTKRKKKVGAAPQA
jgi:hypothetical protein